MKLPPGHVPGLVSQHKATAYGGFGQKMLEKMGWEKGQGLGKEKDGMKEAIEVKKKEDTLGVGANAPTWKWDWKYWEDAYNTGLQSIKKGSSNKKKQADGSSSSDSDSDDSTSTSTSTSSGSDSDSDSGASSGSSSSSDSESDAAAANDSSDSESESDTDSDDERAARIAAAVNRDGTAASASAAELRLAAELAKSSGRGPAGRFGGREGKMARIRQQEAEQAAAMAAKLGIVLPQTAAAGGGKGGSASSSSEDTAAAVAADSSKKQKKQKQKQHKAADAAVGSTEEDSPAAAAAPGKQQKQSKKRNKSEEGQQTAAAEAGVEPVTKKARVVIVVDLKGPSTAESFKSFKPTPSSGWWGAKMFASAGLLEGLEQEQEQRKRTTFDEELQAKVYMAAHDAQRQGKRGIGKRAIKIAGGNWEGKKTTFEEEAAEQQQQQQEQAADDSAAEAAAAAEPKKKKQKSGKQDQQQQQVEVQRNSSDEDKQQKQGAKDNSSSSKKSKKAKWAKLAVVQLQGCAGGVLKWKKLWPQLRAAAEAAGAVLGEDAKEQAWQKLQDSSQLQVNGKLVSLAA